jgi:outer membrane protein, heavy metal efflux system
MFSAPGEGDARRDRDRALIRTAQPPPGAPQPPSLDLSPLSTPGNFPVSAAMGGRPISLQASLYGAVTGNPDLVALRQGNEASAEAVEAARHFPTTLNPTLWIDYRPLNFVPPDTFASSARGGGATQHGYKYAKNYIYISWRQPLELKHQTTHRAAIAQAAFDLQRWNVITAEMTSLVQTYRFYQTAAYRREKARVAKQLADFNEKLLGTLHRRLEANQVLPADVALAEVESQAAGQQYEAAQQDYAAALTDLQNQIGSPETAGMVMPSDRFSIPRYIPNLSEQQLIEMALCSRPEIFAARAQVAGAEAAVRLANADRTPSPIIGPEYESDEVLVQYVGMVFICPIPVLNNGTPLLRQRQAELKRAVVAERQIEQRTAVQVKSALAKWNQAVTLVNRTAGLTKSLKAQVESIERLFDASQADLNKLYQARQRLIQLENAELDAFWQATQAQSDLLLALGAPALIASLQNQVASGVRPDGPQTGGEPASGNAAPADQPAPTPSTGPPPFQTQTNSARTNH